MRSHVKEWKHGNWRIEFEGRNIGQPKEVPAGEWDNEPDKIQWLDEDTGLDCLMVRNHFGSWCGYVGVTEGHPLFGVGYDTENPVLLKMRDDMLQKPVPANPSFAVCIAMLSGELNPSPATVLDVHGGITFADFCSEPTEEQWIKDGRDKLFSEWCDEQNAHRICHVPLPGRPAKVWWFGFDCCHSGDFSPGTRRFPDLNSWRSDVYRNRAYVEEEVTKLARQLKDLELVRESAA
jgi:hypothetical protein